MQVAPLMVWAAAMSIDNKNKLEVTLVTLEAYQQSDMKLTGRPRKITQRAPLTTTDRTSDLRQIRGR